MSGGRPLSRSSGQRRRNNASRAGRNEWSFEEAIGYNGDGAGDRPRSTSSGRATSTNRGDLSNYATSTCRRRPTSRGRTSRPTSRSRGSQRRSTSRSQSRGRRDVHVDSDYTYDEDGTANGLTFDDSDITPLTQQNVSSRRLSSSYENDSADDYTTDDGTEDNRPRRKRSISRGAQRPKSRGRASNGTTARVSASSSDRHRHRHHKDRGDYRRHDSRSRPRRKKGNRSPSPDPLITPEAVEMLSSLSTSLRTGICKSYEVLQQGSANLQSSLEEATRNLPSGDDVAEKIVEAADKAEHMLRLGSKSEDQDVEEEDKEEMEKLQPRPHEEIVLRHSPARKATRQSVAHEGNDEGIGDDVPTEDVARSDLNISDTTEETSMKVGDVEVVLPPSPERIQHDYSSGRDDRKFNDVSMFGGSAYSSIDPTFLRGEGIADTSMLSASSHGRSYGASSGGGGGNSKSLANNRFSFGGTKGGYPVGPSLAQQKKEMEAALETTTSDDGNDTNEQDEGNDEEEVKHGELENNRGESSIVTTTDTGDGDGDIDKSKDGETLPEQLRIISSLRLQIETLQQTAALSQRGWEDARTTLEKERAESSKLQSELENVKDENIRLRERNTELEKMKKDNDAIVQKLNGDNEVLAKELIEAISQQEALKLDAAEATRGHTLTTPDRKDFSAPSTPASSTPSRSLPFDEVKGNKNNVPLVDNNAPTPPAPLSLPSVSPGRSTSTTLTPTESSVQAKARIRAERKARILNRPKSRGRATMRAGSTTNDDMTSNGSALKTPTASQKPPGKIDERSKLPLRVEEAIKDWTIQEESTMEPSQDNQGDDAADWADPDLDPSLFDLQSSIADQPDPPSRRQREPISTPLGRKTVGKNTVGTPATAAATPSPVSNRQRDGSKRQLYEDLQFYQSERPVEEDQDLIPWSSIRSAPHHIVQPPRLFPNDLAKSKDSHAVMTYLGSDSMEPNDDLLAADFDAAYLTLDEANYRARYVFFVLNAMGKEAEDLLDDPRVAVSTTDAASRAWGDRLQLSYRYTDGAGQKLIWKVWVIPAGGFAPSSSSSTKSAGGKVRMLV